MKASSIIVWLVSLLLFGNAGMSFTRTQSKADISPEQRSAELARYTGGPLAGGLATLVGWFVGRRMIQGNASVLSGLRESLGATIKRAPKTTISLDEPNIQLKITLTGDAAKDAAGRRKIGEVMQHYGSGGQARDGQSGRGGAA